MVEISTQEAVNIDEKASRGSAWVWWTALAVLIKIVIKINKILSFSVNTVKINKGKIFWVIDKKNIPCSEIWNLSRMSHMCKGARPSFKTSANWITITLNNLLSSRKLQHSPKKRMAEEIAWGIKYKGIAIKV